MLDATKHGFLISIDSTIKKVDNTNITLGHLLLEATSKKLDKKKVQFNCFNKFCI